MGITKKWFLLETEEDYDNAMARYQKLKNAIKGTIEHKEKIFLVRLIQNFESNHYPLPEVHPIEMIKIRIKEFGSTQRLWPKNMGTREL